VRGDRDFWQIFHEANNPERERPGGEANGKRKKAARGSAQPIFDFETLALELKFNDDRR